MSLDLMFCWHSYIISVQTVFVAMECAESAAIFKMRNVLMDVRSTQKGHLSVNWGEVMLVGCGASFIWCTDWGHENSIVSRAHSICECSLQQ